MKVVEGDCGSDYKLHDHKTKYAFITTTALWGPTVYRKAFWNSDWNFKFKFLQPILIISYLEFGIDCRNVQDFKFYPEVQTGFQLG